MNQTVMLLTTGPKAQLAVKQNMKVFLLSGNYDHCPKLRPKWAVSSPSFKFKKLPEVKAATSLQVLEVTVPVRGAPLAPCH